MNIALWIIAGLLAAGSLASGAMKLTWPRQKLAALGMGWAEDFSASTVKAIGTLEVLAAVGLILPAALGIAPVLVPLAAVGLPPERSHRPEEEANVNSPGNKQQSHLQTPARRHEHRRCGARLADDRRGLRARREAAHPI